MEYQVYVDSDYYKGSFKGSIIPEDVLEQRLMLASHDIDSLTYNRINKVGFDNLTDFQQDLIKKSVCMHADFHYQYGDFLDSPITGYSAGMTSVSFEKLNVEGQNGVSTSKGVFSLLKQTGLTVRLII